MKKTNVLLQLSLLALVAAGCLAGGFWGGAFAGSVFCLFVFVSVGYWLEYKARRKMAAIEKLTDILKANSHEGTTD